MTAALDSPRIDEVDGLRAVAMSMVVAQHCGLLPFGWTGVWLFFVISGYVITRGFLADDAGDGGSRFGAFLRRRALRIVPVYLLYVAVNLLILLAVGGTAKFGDLPYLLSFSQNWHMIFEFWPGSSQWAPFGHLWTLSVEQQFYLVFPLLMLCAPARVLWPLTVSLVLAGPLVRWAWSVGVAAQFDDAGARAFAVYAASVCHFDAFLIGSLLAQAEPRLRAAPQLGAVLWRGALVLGVLYVAAYVFINHSLGAQGVDLLRNVLSGVLYGQGREVLCYVVVDAVAAASLAHALLRGAGTRWLAWPAVAWVGRVSYGAYLFHLLVLWLAAQALGANVREQPVVARLLLFAAVWLVTVALASASFRWFETPIARRGRAWLRPATAACSNPREYPMKTPSLNIVIAIATAGRREQMCLTMAELAKLGMLPARIVVCPASPDDYDADSFPLPACPVDVVHGPRGLTAQRNMILAHCQAADVVVFMDDDFYPAPDYIEQVAELFAREADVVIATNHPQLDGATGPGIAHDEAVHTIATLPPAAPAAPRTEGTYGGYGCNMAIRMAPVRQYTIRFDENLPLYGWLEDIDFSRRVAPHGRIVRCPQLRGVHLGTKRGRGSGLRLGYSQIANPVYMWRKGSMSPTYALRHMAKNFARNLSRSLAPEPWVDRRGRLRGNLLALRDLLRGRLDPRHILQMS